jgi:hypothetical protein
LQRGIVQHFGPGEKFGQLFLQPSLFLPLIVKLPFSLKFAGFE